MAVPGVWPAHLSRLHSRREGQGRSGWNRRGRSHNRVAGNSGDRVVGHVDSTADGPGCGAGLKCSSRTANRLSGGSRPRLEPPAYDASIALDKRGSRGPCGWVRGSTRRAGGPRRELGRLSFKCSALEGHAPSWLGSVVARVRCATNDATEQRRDGARPSSARALLSSVKRS
jgi:hypothetical protein